jgi:hypothetical protein
MKDQECKRQRDRTAGLESSSLAISTSTPLYPAPFWAGDADEPFVVVNGESCKASPSRASSLRSGGRLLDEHPGWHIITLARSVKVGVLHVQGQFSTADHDRVHPSRFPAPFSKRLQVTTCIDEAMLCRRLSLCAQFPADRARR